MLHCVLMPDTSATGYLATNIGQSSVRKSKTSQAFHPVFMVNLVPNSCLMSNALNAVGHMALPPDLFGLLGTSDMPNKLDN